MKALILGLLLAAAPVEPPPAPAGASVGAMVWLSGVWMSRSEDGRWSDEYWTLPKDGIMLGAGYSGRDGKVQFFEHMRIATDRGGRVNLFALENGGPAVVFPLVRQAEGLAVFENPRHDYPQRITYQLQGDGMVATISLMDGSRQMQWQYRRPG